MPYIRKLAGTKVFLAPLDPGDAVRFTEWLNDLEVTKYLTLASLNITVDKERETLHRISGDHNYAVVDIESGEAIGAAGLDDIDPLNRTAEIGIFLGDKARWGRGCGTEAMTLLADYAFHVLGVRNLMLRCFDFNDRGIACYKKIGFKEIGRRRKARFWNGEYRDVVLMDLLAEDFGPTRIPALDVPGPGGV